MAREPLPHAPDQTRGTIEQRMQTPVGMNDQGELNLVDEFGNPIGEPDPTEENE